jgi:hypothetical protein
MKTTQGCHSCVHRYGKWREYWRCSRVGLFTDIEMRYGGKCSAGGELRLWAPRPSILHRVIKIIRRETP